jgi:hypothetical protein
MSAFSALETKVDTEPGKTAQDFLKQDAGRKQMTPRSSRPSQEEEKIA